MATQRAIGTSSGLFTYSAVAIYLLTCLCSLVVSGTELPKSAADPVMIDGELPSIEAEKRASLPYYNSIDNYPFDSYLSYAYMPSSAEAERILNSLRPNKRAMDDGQMPGVLRFGKRSQSFIRFGRSAAGMDDDMGMVAKKEMPGVLRFGKRRIEGQQEKKAVPGVLRFGKRDADMPGVLRFGKREMDMPGVLRFGKRSDMPGVLRFGKRDVDMPGVLRFGKREMDMPGVLRFGKRDGDMPGVLRFGKKSEMPGVLRFGKRSGDMPGVLRFGKRSTDMPGVLRFG